MDYHKILTDIYQEILPYAGMGAQADYIPALAKVDPDQFGIALRTVTGESYEYLQSDTRFSIQSISKVFAVAMALSLKGEDLWKIVGKEIQNNDKTYNFVEAEGHDPCGGCACS